MRLPPDEFLRRWYATEYSRNAYGSVAGRVQKHMHSSLERGYSSEVRFERTLEVGANRGEHLAYVNHGYQEYVQTDLHIPGDNSVPRRHSSGSAYFEIQDATQLSYPDACFDRVVCTCLLHHVGQPETILKEIRRVLVANGTADILLSSDPGFMFRLARWLGPKWDAKKRGLLEVKRLVDARDHIGHVGAIEVLISHVFREDEIAKRSYPLPQLPWNLSLWSTYRIVRTPQK